MRNQFAVAIETDVNSLLAFSIAELFNYWFSEPEGLGSSGPCFSSLKYFNYAMRSLRILRK